MMKNWIKFIVLSLLITVFTAGGVRAVSVDDFISRSRLKFRQTPTIHLEATSRVVDEPSDTTYVSFSYQYPDKILQWVQRSDSSEQITIISGDSAVVSYPHLDVERRAQLTERQKTSLLADNFPLAVLAAGLETDTAVKESMSVRGLNNRIEVNIEPENRNQRYRRGQAIFDWPQLHPVSLTVEMANNGARHRIEVEHYREDQRLPRHIEDAIGEMDTEQLEGDLK